MLKVQYKKHYIKHMYLKHALDMLLDKGCCTWVGICPRETNNFHVPKEYINLVYYTDTDGHGIY